MGRMSVFLEMIRAMRIFRAVSRARWRPPPRCEVRAAGSGVPCRESDARRRAA